MRYSAASAAGPCAMPGCAGVGEYKAPRSRDNIRDYQWLCLAHIREFNKQWEFFEAAWIPGEIEAFMQDAVTGHRPTWQRRAKIIHADQIRSAITRRWRMSWAASWAATAAARPVHLASRAGTKERRALATLELIPLPAAHAEGAHYCKPWSSATTRICTPETARMSEEIQADRRGLCVSACALPGGVKNRTP